MTLLTALGRPAGGRAGHEHADAALSGLAVLRRAPDWGWVEISRPSPTAAFSRLDTLAAGYPEAAAAARERGFTPVVRPAGGRLAAYHEGALLIDVLARHPEPERDIDARFQTLAEAVVAALRALGLKVGVGPVPGEYCPGRFSVNAEGRTKLAGTAQRLTRGSFFLSTVVLVCDPEPIRAVLAAAYPLLGLHWDPATVGCVADYRTPVAPEHVQAAVLAALQQRLPLAVEPAPAPAGAVRVPLQTRWDAS